MKTLFLSILLLVGQNAFSALLGADRDWEFIQTVGGISIGEPKLENSKWLLPVHCDVSGLKNFTVKPSTLNSGLVWSATKVRVKGNVIYLSIETAVAGLDGKSSMCGPAKLGRLKPGRYTVIYLSPDKMTHTIGDVEIGL